MPVCRQVRYPKDNGRNTTEKYKNKKLKAEAACPTVDALPNCTSKQGINSAYSYRPIAMIPAAFQVQMT
jgi:hypothetical protein